jgi:DNA polymerase-1
MIDIAQEIKAKNLKGKMLLQVHDELVFDIPVSEKEAFLKLVRDNMENVLSKETFHATKKSDIPPLVVDIHTGKNWTEAKG